MPIFDQGYQHWDGKLSSHAWRWFTISARGARSQFKSRWVRLAILGAWIPAAVLATVLIAWGLIEQKSKLILPFLSLFHDLPESIMLDPRSYRVTIWTIAYQYFFLIEMFFSMILVLLVGPSLISRDIRFNAIPLYFSRPLRRFDYFAGKLGVIGFFLAAVAVVPALIAYVLGLCFSMDLTVVRDTARLMIASVGYGLIVVVSAGMLMLAISSLSRNSRYVGAFWVGIWFVSNVVGGALQGWVKASWCPLVSYTGNLLRINHVLLDTDSAWDQIGSLMDPRNRDAILVGFRGPTYPWYWSLGVLAGLLGISLCILTTRVKSLDRLK
ncbi:MAG TPA: ABC transporter permease subunit [Gemmataceae bacterium]|nr:ABC transporter permease subunit [Gemmataceae bacterium]